ncbi:DUF6541 family protein [Xylanimonas oleitrophica]|uniref:DUF6541 family protein n=1 Tax=Xylanimonas oleitrophica TaxID=2607479 RepID=UPI0015D081A6|nr:DUF6541 family protein [Xylanimonas oleitrophica]
MSWGSAADELVLAALWAVGPGALLALAVGLRREWVLFAAPLLSVALLAAWPVLLGAAGVPWGRGVAVAVTVLTAAASAGVRVAAARRSSARAAGRHARAAAARRDPRRDVLRPVVMAAALAGAAVWTAVPFMQGMGRPDRMPQTWDAVFHLNAARWVLDHGDASSLALGGMTSPVTGSGFYPAAWHTLVALSTTSSVVVSTNAVVIVVAGLVWPLGVAALARATLPRWSWFPPVAAVVSVGFTAFPTGLVTWGTVWPNALAYALVPGTVAVTMRALAPGRGRAAAALTAVAGTGAIALSQPSALLVYASIATFPVLTAFGRTLVRGTPLQRAAALGGMVVWSGGWLVVWRTFASAIRTTAWHGSAGFTTGALSALGDRYAPTPPETGVVALVVVGVLVSFAVRGARWVPLALAGLLALVGVAQQESAWSWWVHPFFADPARLSGAVPLVSALLVALAVCGCAVGLGRLVGGAGRRPRGAVLGAVTALALLGAVVVTGGLQQADRSGVLRAYYVDAAAPELPDSLVSPGEMEMLERLGEELGPGQVLLGSPFSGAALAYAVADVDVVFPHMRGAWSPAARFLGQHFGSIGEDPRVCDAVRELGVGYYYADTDVYFPTHRDHALYEGLTPDVPSDGFELVDSGDTAAVYRITACG